MSIAEGYGSPAELQEQVRSLRTQLAERRREITENHGVIAVWRRRAEKAEADLAEAQRTLSKKYLTAHISDQYSNPYEAELAAEKARADRLEAAIRNAPHWGGCAMFNTPNGPCNCWKCEALEWK